MNHCDEELRKAVALFRYGLIADVLRLPPGSREIRHTLREKAQRTYTTPDPEHCGPRDRPARVCKDELPHFDRCRFQRRCGGRDLMSTPTTKSFRS